MIAKKRDVRVKIIIARTQSGKYENMIDLLKEKLLNVCENASVEIWDGTRSAVSPADLKKAGADLFIDFNLSGFEQDTLTGGIAYNLLNSKQVHFLLDDGLFNEPCLAKQLSIAMFFYCVGHEYYRHLSDAYPDIPYLKEMDGWNNENTDAAVDKNAGILCSIILDVARICRL